MWHRTAGTPFARHAHMNIHPEPRTNTYCLRIRHLAQPWLNYNFQKTLQLVIIHSQTK